jgi:pyruvate kinase
MVDRPRTGTELYTEAVKAAVMSGAAGLGDMVTVTAGMPVGHVPYTNTLRLVEVTQAYINMAFEE